MTPEKAIKFFDEEIVRLEGAPIINGCEMTDDWREQLEVCKLAKSALEKQIPKKPILVETKCFDGSTADFVFVCPVCNRKICSEPTDDVMASFLKEDYPHCNCGQALDWSDME